MIGKLIKIDDRWVVEYSEQIIKGGKKGVLGGYTRSIKTKTLPLLMDSTTFPKDRREFVIGSRVKFKEVLINSMGREVDPYNLGQNHSGCVWCAKIIDEDKEVQKQHIIDMIKSDEELGLYDKSHEIKPEDVFNDEKRKGFKEFISKYPKSITKEELIDRYIDETGYGMDMWGKTENETFTTIIKILYDRK